MAIELRTLFDSALEVQVPEVPPIDLNYVITG
jgi:hypothetical protein